MLNIVGVGDNVCDKYLHQKLMYPGGQALNVAVYCKKAGHRGAYMGVFGSDGVSAHVQRTLQELKVDISHCRCIDGENGYAVVDLVEGDRVFVTSNKGGVLREHPLVLNQSDLRYLQEFDLIHTSNNSYLDSQLPKLKELPPFVSYDFSGSWTDGERAKRICPHIDFAFLSCSGLGEDEARQLQQQLHRWGAGLVIATRGEENALLYNGETYYSQTPKRVQPVDTLGAGDSFAAGFLMYYLENWKNSSDPDALLAGAMENGAMLSAETCMVYGAFGCGAPIA